MRHKQRRADIQGDGEQDAQNTEKGVLEDTDTGGHRDKGAKGTETLEEPEKLRETLA